MSYIEELNARAGQAAAAVKATPLKALQIVLNEMPVRASKIGVDKKDKNFEKVKAETMDVAAKNVLTTLCAVDGTKLAAAIKGLTDSERDTLMKFIYRGFGERTQVKQDNGDSKTVCTYDCAMLLKAHDEICKNSGTGPVIRSIHTRLDV